MIINFAVVSLLIEWDISSYAAGHQEIVAVLLVDPLHFAVNQDHVIWKLLS